MTQNQWLLIALLAVGAYGIRLIGLIGGQAINDNPRLQPLLEELPGCLVVALVAASLTGQPPLTWLAALVALGVAVVTNNVVITMVGGIAALIGLGYIAVSF